MDDQSGAAPITQEDNSSTPPAHKGSWFAYMNDYGFAATRTRSVRTSPSPPRHDGHADVLPQRGLRGDHPTQQFDTLQVQVPPNGGSAFSTRATYSNHDAGRGYVACSVDLSAYVGQTVTLRFYGTENGNNRATGFLVDDVSLKADWVPEPPSAGATGAASQRAPVAVAVAPGDAPRRRGSRRGRA